MSPVGQVCPERCRKPIPKSVRTAKHQEWLASPGRGELSSIVEVHLGEALLSEPEG